MSVYRMLDELEAVVSQGKKTILQSDKISVSQDTLYGLIDAIRNSLPEDLRDAQFIKREQQRLLETAQEEAEEIIADAHKQYEEIMRQAEEIANRKIMQSEIVKEAEKVAEDIVYHANGRAHELTEGAFLYANDIMSKLEKQLAIYVDVVQEGRQELHKSLQKNSRIER